MKNSNKTDKATARPWSKSEFTASKIVSGFGKQICDCESRYLEDSVAQANTALIVCAVNCHDELVDALESAIGCIEASLDEVPSEAREAQENDLKRYRATLLKVRAQ